MSEKDLVFAICGSPERHFNAENLYKAMDTLTENERGVLLDRFGLGRCGWRMPPMTFKEISSRLLNQKTGKVGVSGERVRQTEAMAIRKMKHPSRYKTFILD